MITLCYVSYEMLSMDIVGETEIENRNHDIT